MSKTINLIAQILMCMVILGVAALACLYVAYADIDESNPFLKPFAYALIVCLAIFLCIVAVHMTDVMFISNEKNKHL